MLDRLRPFLPLRARVRARETLRALAAFLPAQASAPLPDCPAPIPPMRPLHPPAATNDNPLQAVHEAVERELRAGGHLR